jgi:hypothetical protein
MPNGANDRGRLVGRGAGVPKEIVIAIGRRTRRLSYCGEMQIFGASLAETQLRRATLYPAELRALTVEAG